MRILIVDDEAPARAKLRRLLGAESDAEIVGEAASGDEAVRRIEELEPDVVFLDVQMPGRDGFAVVASLKRNRTPRIVFITAHVAHAIRAFDVRAVDYLLKPVPPGRFRAMMNRVREDIARGEGSAGSGITEQLHQMALAMASAPKFLDRILVKAENKSVFILVKRIDWIDADRNYVRLHVGPASYLERSTINQMAARLDPAAFLRINRSQIVRLDAVRELQPWSHGDYRVIMLDGTSLSWSRRYRAESEQGFRPAAL
jgi:two-component system LytT family response regulator